MIPKLRKIIFILLSAMLFPGVTCGGNLLLGGINQDKPVCDEPCSSNTNLDTKGIATDLKADYFPMYYGKPYPGSFENIDEVHNAALGIDTDKNGLTYLLDLKPEEKNFDTIVAYSGGTATAVTALANYNKYGITCDTLILISPMAAGVSDERYAEVKKDISECNGNMACLYTKVYLDDFDRAKAEAEASYAAQIKAILTSDPPVAKKIIVVTSDQDKLPYGDVFQVRDFDQYTHEEVNMNTELTPKVHKASSGEVVTDIPTWVSVITTKVTVYTSPGEEGHKALFPEFTKNYLSTTDDGAIEYNPEGNPIESVPAPDQIPRSYAVIVSEPIEDPLLSSPDFDEPSGEGPSGSDVSDIGALTPEQMDALIEQMQKLGKTIEEYQKDLGSQVSVNIWVHIRNQLLPADGTYVIAIDGAGNEIRVELDSDGKATVYGEPGAWEIATRGGRYVSGTWREEVPIDTVGDCELQQISLPIWVDE